MGHGHDDGQCHTAAAAGGLNLSERILRYRIQETASVGVPGVAKDLLTPTALYDLSFLQDGYALARCAD